MFGVYCSQNLVQFVVTILKIEFTSDYHWCERSSRVLAQLLEEQWIAWLVPGIALHIVHVVFRAYHTWDRLKVWFPSVKENNGTF